MRAGFGNEREDEGGVENGNRWRLTRQWRDSKFEIQDFRTDD
jgi:hypothetical protein